MQTAILSIRNAWANNQPFVCFTEISWSVCRAETHKYIKNTAMMQVLLNASAAAKPFPGLLGAVQLSSSWAQHITKCTTACLKASFRLHNPLKQSFLFKNQCVLPQAFALLASRFMELNFWVRKPQMFNCSYAEYSALPGKERKIRKWATEFSK